ncbi:hypothetical protein PENTCL1PPCAC_26896, partial [Pristionchus entomophagus]
KINIPQLKENHSSQLPHKKSSSQSETTASSP